MLINDASITGSLIVNASASFQHIIVSGNIIPDTNSTRNLGSTDRYFKEIYVSTSSINFVDNGSVVAVLNAGTINAIQVTTASANSRLAAIENFTSSLNNTYTTDAELNASSSTLQLNIDTKLNSSSFNSFTASVSATNTFTSSATARLNALETTSASVDTLNTAQNSRLGSLETISASNINRISSLEANSASVNTLNTTQNSRLNSLELKTGSLATTGSNLFIGSQTITGSLYISADLVVQGTSSIQNITGSSISIGTNIVQLNTATPSVRHAGLTVQDSGSSAGVTGSILWDSLCNKWVYSNPSTIGYSGGMLLSGPRTTTLGSESPLTCNYIAKSGGGDHLYDSAIYESGSCVGIGTSTPLKKLDIVSTGEQLRLAYDTSGTVYSDFRNDSAGGLLINTSGPYIVNYINGSAKMRIDANAICFPVPICSAGLNTTNSITILKNASVDNRYLQFCDTTTGGYRWDLILQSTAQGCGFGIYNNTANNYALRFTPDNLGLFTSGICAASVTSTGNVSGTTIYASTVSCSPIGCFDTLCATYLYPSQISMGNTFIYAAGNRLGIGTANPLGVLSINGGSNSIAGLATYSSIEPLGIFNMFYTNSGTYPFYLDIAAIGDTMSTNGGSNIRFLTHCGIANATPVERMRITNCGYVGIGTASPSTPLHVCTSISQIARFTTTHSLSSGYADYMTLLASNQTGGGLSFNIGKAESSYNLGKLVFNYVGDQSTSNNLSFGFYNYDNKLVIVGDGTVRPGGNGTQNLGSASYRWCTIYTSDLSLSNGIGDYTIVEGENDLFLYNNKQCKVYKFMLQQVCIECAPAKMS